MNDRPQLGDDDLRDLLERRANRARTDGLLASVRSAAAMTPQRRFGLPGRGFMGSRVAAGVAAVASLAVLVVVVAVAGGSRVPDAGFVSGSASPGASAVAPGSAEPPATPVVPTATQPVLPLTLDQLNAILLPNSSALLGRQLVITGTIDVNLCCSPSVGSPAFLAGSIPILVVSPSGGTAFPSRLPYAGVFAAKMTDTRTLEYEGVVTLTAAGGAFMPSDLFSLSDSARAGVSSLVQGWIAGFDVALPCASIPGPLHGPQYNGCGVTSSLSDTGSQPVAGTTFRVPRDGIQVQDRAYDAFAPDPSFSAEGTEPELATFLVSRVLPAPCQPGYFCAFEPATKYWQIIDRVDPWPTPGQTAPPTGLPTPSPAAVEPVQPLTVAQLNAFMAMNSQSPEGRQLVISGRIAANPLSLGPGPDQGCRYSDGGWTCPPAYLVDSNPKLGVEPVGDIGPGPWDAIGGSDLNGPFAATLNGFTLDYQGPVETTANGGVWLPGELPSPTKPGVGEGYWLVQGWIASPPIHPACPTGPSPYPGPQFRCGTQTTLGDGADDAQAYVAAGDLPHTLRVQNGAYETFAPDPANPAGDVPEQATFLVQAISIPACGPTQDCFIPPGNYHWAIVARIGPWPVPDVTPPAQP